MNKSDLILELADQHSLSRKQAETIVHSIFAEMKDTLQRSERVEFRGFGTFAVRQYERYLGRNPKTGEQAEVPSKKRIRYRMSEVLFSRMNEHFGSMSKEDI